MKEKNKLHETAALLYKQELAKEFCITEPIAKDFVPKYVSVDLYCDSSCDETTYYITLGLCSEFLPHGWSEIGFNTTTRLNYDDEKTVTEEISNIICKLHSEQIDISESAAFKTSKPTKDAFGFDYFTLVMYDFDFKNILGEPIVVLLVVPIYENEYQYLTKNGIYMFMEEYEAQVPDDCKTYIDVARAPMKL